MSSGFPTILVFIAFVFAALTGSAPAAAFLPGDAAAPAGRSSSWWLKRGERLQEQEKHDEASVAYAQALDVLPEARKRANVGARAAMLSADASWSAFEVDGDLTHLRSAVEVLERWIALTGPGSGASLLASVERTTARLKAIQRPLEGLYAALDRYALDEAAKRLDPLIDVWVIQERPWPTGAKIVLTVANAYVDTYDRSIAEVDDVALSRPKLERAKSMLQRWQAEQPEDDDSAQGPAVIQLIADIDARIEAGVQRVEEVRVAEQQRLASEAAVREEQRRRQERRMVQQNAELAAQSAREAVSRRRTSIVMLAAGTVVTAAGAGLVGESLAYNSATQRSLDDERTEASVLEQMNPAGYDQEGFNAAANDFSDRVRRRNLAMLGSGAALVGSGLAIGITGAVMFVRNRRKAPRTGTQARLVPLVARAYAGVSLATRF